MSKKRKTNYDRYKATFELAKSEHRLKIGARMLTKYEYDRTYENTRYEQNEAMGKNLSPREIRKLIMDTQAIDRDRALRAYKEYKRAIYDPYMKKDNDIKAVWVSDDTYWGNESPKRPLSEEEKMKLNKKEREKAEKEEARMDKIMRHSTFAGFMRDKHAVHYMIAAEILNGRDREEVLADYGY